MSKLQRRVEALEKRTGSGGQQFHVIEWWEKRETEEKAKQRYLSQNPDVVPRPGDLWIFIRHFAEPEEVME